MPENIRKLTSWLFDFILDVDSFVLQFHNRCLHSYRTCMCFQRANITLILAIKIFIEFSINLVIIMQNL